MSSAVVRSAWAPVRGEPSHRAELVSQWLCGERLRVEERTGTWLRCRGPDGYRGWSPLGSLAELADAEAEAWERRATGWSLGAPLRGTLGRLPWGARVALQEGARIGLPDGRVVEAADPERVVAAASLPEMFPANGESVVLAARRWLGAPYLWGGRTETGVDCSGFVQAVFAVHGVALPRDSRDQAEVGPSLAGEGDELAATEPGDLLFFAPEGRGITHVAIACGDRRVIHAADSNGGVAEDGLGGSGGLAAALRGSIVTATRPLATTSAPPPPDPRGRGAPVPERPR